MKQITIKSALMRVMAVLLPAFGTVSASAQYYMNIRTSDGTIVQYFVKDVDSVWFTSSDHEFVDLGLSVKWATCNVGAEKPEEYGDLYAWGETAPKTSYTWTNYKFRTDGDSRDDVKFSKYNTVSSYGPVDKKPVLDLEDDVANAKWGGSWRLPTQAELDELINDCTWKWYSKGNSTFGGVAGYKVTSKKYTNRFIFLPAAGYKNDTNLSAVGSRGYYWSSSLNSEYPYCVWHVYFNDSNVSQINNDRNRGFSVRPVCP